MRVDKRNDGSVGLVPETAEDAAAIERLCHVMSEYSDAIAAGAVTFNIKFDLKFRSKEDVARLRKATVGPLVVPGVRAGRLLS